MNYTLIAVGWTLLMIALVISALGARGTFELNSRLDTTLLVITTPLAVAGFGLTMIGAWS